MILQPDELVEGVLVDVAWHAFAERRTALHDARTPGEAGYRPDVSHRMNPPVEAPVHGTWSMVLLGDWGRWVRDPIDLIRLSFLVGALVTLAAGPREQSFRLLLTFLLVLVPRAIDAPRPFDFAFCVGMAFQAWGNVFAAFDTVPLYDKLVHLVLPWGTSMLLYLLLVRASLVPELEDETGINTRAALLLVTFAFGISVGAVYEMYEYFADHVLGAHLHVSYGDTIADLTADAVGSALGGLTMLAWDRYGWGTRRRVPGPMLER